MNCLHSSLVTTKRNKLENSRDLEPGSKFEKCKELFVLISLQRMCCVVLVSRNLEVLSYQLKLTKAVSLRLDELDEKKKSIELKRIELNFKFIKKQEPFQT